MKMRTLKIIYGQAWWFRPITLATWEAEMEKIVVEVSPGEVKLYLNQ
jgi:hypothetical protein